MASRRTLQILTLAVVLLALYLPQEAQSKTVRNSQCSDVGGTCVKNDKRCKNLIEEGTCTRDQVCCNVNNNEKKNQRQRPRESGKQNGEERRGKKEQAKNIKPEKHRENAKDHQRYRKPDRQTDKDRKDKDESPRLKPIMKKQMSSQKGDKSDKNNKKNEREDKTGNNGNDEPRRPFKKSAIRGPKKEVNECQSQGFSCAREEACEDMAPRLGGCKREGFVCCKDVSQIRKPVKMTRVCSEMGGTCRAKCQGASVRGQCPNGETCCQGRVKLSKAISKRKRKCKPAGFNCVKQCKGTVINRDGCLPGRVCCKTQKANKCKERGGKCQSADKPCSRSINPKGCDSGEVCCKVNKCIKAGAVCTKTCKGGEVIKKKGCKTGKICCLKKKACNQSGGRCRQAKKCKEDQIIPNTKPCKGGKVCCPRDKGTCKKLGGNCKKAGKCKGEVVTPSKACKDGKECCLVSKDTCEANKGVCRKESKCTEPDQVITVKKPCKEPKVCCQKAKCSTSTNEVCTAAGGKCKNKCKDGENVVPDGCSRATCVCCTTQPVPSTTGKPGNTTTPSATTAKPDTNATTVKPDGSASTPKPNGTATTATPDGSKTTKTPVSSATTKGPVTGTTTMPQQSSTPRLPRIYQRISNLRKVADALNDLLQSIFDVYNQLSSVDTTERKRRRSINNNDSLYRKRRAVDTEDEVNTFFSDLATFLSSIESAVTSRDTTVVITLTITVNGTLLTNATTLVFSINANSSFLPSDFSTQLDAALASLEEAETTIQTEVISIIEDINFWNAEALREGGTTLVLTTLNNNPPKATITSTTPSNKVLERSTTSALIPVAHVTTRMDGKETTSTTDTPHTSTRANNNEKGSSSPKESGQDTTIPILVDQDSTPNSAGQSSLLSKEADVSKSTVDIHADGKTSVDIASTEAMELIFTSPIKITTNAPGKDTSKASNPSENFTSSVGQETASVVSRVSVTAKHGQDTPTTDVTPTFNHDSTVTELTPTHGKTSPVIVITSTYGQDDQVTNVTSTYGKDTAAPDENLFTNSSSSYINLLSSAIQPTTDIIHTTKVTRILDGNNSTTRDLISTEKDQTERNTKENTYQLTEYFTESNDIQSVKSSTGYSVTFTDSQSKSSYKKISTTGKILSTKAYASSDKTTNGIQIFTRGKSDETSKSILELHSSNATTRQVSYVTTILPLDTTTPRLPAIYKKISDLKELSDVMNNLLQQIYNLQNALPTVEKRKRRQILEAYSSSITKSVAMNTPDDVDAFLKTIRSLLSKIASLIIKRDWTLISSITVDAQNLVEPANTLTAKVSTEANFVPQNFTQQLAEIFTIMEAVEKDLQDELESIHETVDYWNGEALKEGGTTITLTVITNKRPARGSSTIASTNPTTKDMVGTSGALKFTSTTKSTAAQDLTTPSVLTTITDTSYTKETAVSSETSKDLISTTHPEKEMSSITKSSITTESIKSLTQGNPSTMSSLRSATTTQVYESTALPKDLSTIAGESSIGLATSTVQLALSSKASVVSIVSDSLSVSSVASTGGPGKLPTSEVVTAKSTTDDEVPSGASFVSTVVNPSSSREASAQVTTTNGAILINTSISLLWKYSPLPVTLKSVLA
ncbi:hypothetical protein SK128_006251 [Halocaridina rubra]|uniref:Uncharacterized protein n=1 Tax=Halocaridina rubra TaxID=373956 RepID=A0AAN8XNE3_HALRR